MKKSKILIMLVLVLGFTFGLAAPAYAIDVDFEVMPEINIGAQGVLPVTIYGSETFDVENLDPETIVIGSTGIRDKGKKLHFAFEDANEDGYLDAVFKFSIPELVLNGDLDELTTSLTVSGELLDGTVFEGTDDVIIVPLI